MDPSNTANIAALAADNNQFAVDLFRILRKRDGNLFFSPFSISVALAMTYAGARANTKAEIARALNFAMQDETLHPTFEALLSHLNSIQTHGSIQLSIANSLWPHQGYAFLNSYLAQVEKHYQTSISPVNYEEPQAAQKTINTWVEEKTNHKIRELIGPGILNSLTRLVLVNAIYFKGSWEKQFDEARTSNTAFRTGPDKSIQVPMMTQKHTFKYARTDHLQILELPYLGHDLSLMVLLPDSDDGLESLEESLTDENLNRWSGLMRQEDVVVFLPKFKTSTKFPLKGTFTSMGMVDAFIAGKADFSGMDGREEWLYISAILHEATCELNEEGSEASAATAVVMQARGLPEPPMTFRADHPFLYLIRDNASQSILFLGRMLNPEG